VDLFPPLARLKYASDLQDAGLDQGLGGAIIYPAIVLGNASLALTQSPAPRSLPRLAMTTTDWPARSFRAYVANHVYVYPEHMDYDAVDLFPAQWPYMVTSQGSSGSDLPFVRALAMAVAAFRPETRDRLQSEGLMAATLQMILRRSQRTVYARDAYLSPLAHPTAFDPDQISPERMVALAAAIKPDVIPPLVRLSVMAEDFTPTAGLAQLSERLFDTPSAIARIWRGADWERDMTVSARQTVDLNGHALQFSWVLLQGDPADVRIEPLDPAGTQARITMRWPAMPAPDAPRPRKGTRIDVGVFAWNGFHDSAPAVISVSFPDHELRHYAPDATGQMRLIDIDYDAIGRGVGFDPLLHWSAPWRDILVDDGASAARGWWREQGGQRAYLGPEDPSSAAVGYLIDDGAGGLPVLRLAP
jgi:hypothetical protein